VPSFFYAASMIPGGGGVKMINEYDKLIGLIYDGIVDENSWNFALARVADLVGASSVALGMQDMKTHEFRHLGASSIDHSLGQSDLLSPYNVIWQEIARKRRPMTDCIPMQKPAFVGMQLFADWFGPQGLYTVMAFPTFFEENRSAVVFAFRDRTLGNFDAADLTEIGKCGQHFGRALSIRLTRERTVEELAESRLMLDDIQDAMFLVDRDARSRHANAAARMMLEQGKVIRSRGGRVEVQESKAQARLAAIIAGGHGGELRLTGPGRKRWTIEVRPCPHGARATYRTLRIMDQDRQREPPTPARLRERLGLTHRQSEVIVELAGGATEGQAARKLSLGEPTLHTHVRRVYEKLDLRSRAELLALLTRCGFDTTRGCE
jgi:DNA-binding CsgD family transcriptional regulator/PAS domain-containing protein